MPIRCLSLILLLITAAACSSRRDAAIPSPADRYVESVNTVSGSFTVDAIFNHDNKPYTFNFTQAYARVVKNPADQSKQEVLIMLLEKPLSRFALAVAENSDAEAGAEEMDEVLQNRDARGVVFRIPVGGSSSDVKVRPFFTTSAILSSSLSRTRLTRSKARSSQTFLRYRSTSTSV